MAAFSTRGLRQLTQYLKSSKRFSRHDIKLTYCRVSSLQYYQRYCSTLSNDQGTLFDEHKEDIEDSSSSQEIGGRRQSFQKNRLKGSSSEFRKSIQKAERVSENVSSENLENVEETPPIVLRGIGPTSYDQNKRKLLVPDQPENAKILKISIIGTPNAGKSTLTNCLMNWKVSSVSKKVHTTRKTTLAICTEDEAQIIFLDTPGVLDPAKKKKHNLEDQMVKDPAESAEKADMIGVLVDVSDSWTRTSLDKNILKILHMNKHIPSVLILNKVDLVKHKGILLNISKKLLNGMCGGKPLPSVDDKKKPTLENVLSDYHTKQQNKDDDDNNLQSRFLDDDDDNIAYNRSGQYKDFDDGYNRYDDYNRYNRHNGYDDDYNRRDRNNDYDEDRCTISEKVLQPFLKKTKEKIAYYRNQKDEDRIVKTHSLHVLDDVRYRLTLLSVDINPALTRVTEQLMEDNEVDEKTLNRQLENQTGWSHFSNVFMISALRNDGVKEIKEYLKNEAKPGDWQYHSSLVTEKSPQDIAVSLLQEQLLEHLPYEIPYNVKPKISTWKLNEDDLFIVMTLETRANRDMKYLIGRQGVTIRSISERTRQELQNALRCEVDLRLKCELK